MQWGKILKNKKLALRRKDKKFSLHINIDIKGPFLISERVYNKIIKKIRIDPSWVDENLIDHGLRESDPKIKLRVYSIKFSGNRQEFLGFIRAIVQKLPDFVLSQKEIRKYRKNSAPYTPYIEAIKFFGDIDPEKDGKYGEFILFLMVEAILKCPMIAHKIVLYNSRDQTKGSDALFLGKYGALQAILIGEAKIEKEASKPIDRALNSIDRFYKNINGGSNLDYELLVAKKDISEDFSGQELDYIYDALSPQSQEYKNSIKVHPILIIYNEKEVENIEKLATDNEDAERRLKEHIKKLLDELYKETISKVNGKSGLSKVYFDFFFIPTGDVTQFRHDFYQIIHGVPYKNARSTSK